MKRDGEEWRGGGKVMVSGVELSTNPVHRPRIACTYICTQQPVLHVKDTTGNGHHLKQ